MKIEGLGSLHYQRKPAEQKNPPAGGKTAARQDQLTLSPDAQRAAGDTRLEGVQKQERLDSLKARVESGSYFIPGEQVADAILRRAGFGSGRV